MFPEHVASERRRWPSILLRLAVSVLLLKVLAGILWEYRLYLPPDFDSAFLTGRKATFTATYAAAFYTHLVCGPLTLLIGTVLMASSGVKRLHRAHRWLGRTQLFVILLALVPSSLVMATQAMAGPIAGLGFTLLALATGYAVSAAACYAWSRRFALHQLWATRCFVLLISPLILRLVSGLLTVTQLESPAAYCWNAWLSWLAPLLLYEVTWRYTEFKGSHWRAAVASQSPWETSP